MAGNGPDPQAGADERHLEVCPHVRAAYNAQEQAGIHDALGMLLQMVGADSKPQGSVVNMICVTPGKGTDFIKFWK